MMTSPGRKIAAQPRRSFATLSRNLHFKMRRLSHELVKELARLNSARIGRSELARLAPRDRVRAVKGALAAHHQGISRCC
jgi:hypothetical protein